MSAPQIQKLQAATDVRVVGGKAKSLGDLLRANYKTQDGFVVTAATFGKMSSDLEKEILQYFDELDAKYVAVRSSATAEDGKTDAWAGQLDTFLNVSRSELIKTIRQSWDAVNSDRAKSYAKAKGIKAGKVAVIIQPMQQSEVAGIAFSVHPVTQNKNQIVIEAGLGLGEAVVSGEVTPDTYVIDKKSEKILEKHISKQSIKLVQGKSGKNEWRKIDNDKQKLPDKKIKELSQTVTDLEKFYGFPIDTEWLIKDDVLFIMQARPITAL